MAGKENSRPSVSEAIKGGKESVDELKKLAKDKEMGASIADEAADLIIGLNAGDVKADKSVVEGLLTLAEAAAGERLRTVLIGTLWREDIDWLSIKLDSGEAGRERILRIVAGDRPKALSPTFWRAVSDRGPSYAAIAFSATESVHPHEAARLLVSLCRAAVAGQYTLDIRSSVDSFLAKQDSSVRTTFLGEIKRLPEAEKRKLMNHLDMSLMAELDRDAIDHRGKSFFYDEDAEKRKRDEKSKDIFDEVRRRLEKGEKSQL